MKNQKPDFQRKQRRILSALSADFTTLFLITIDFALGSWAFDIAFRRKIAVGQETLDQASTTITQGVLVPMSWSSDKSFFFLLVLTLGMGILLFLIPAIAGLADKERDHNQIITLTPNENPLKFALEFLFAKHPVFRNSHRNWPELQALFAVIVIALVGLIVVQGTWVFHNSVHQDISFEDFSLKLINSIGEDFYGFIWKSALGLGSLYLAIYIYLKKDYGEKWKYCADVYNKYLLSEATHTHNPTQVSPAQAALAIDIMFMDLWAKRGFSRFFFNCVKTAIENDPVITPDKKAEALNLIVSSDPLPSRLVEEVLERALFPASPPQAV